MKPTAIILLVVLILFEVPAVYASSKHTPLRYTNQPRNLKHAGTLPVSSDKTSILNLNYTTGAGLNYPKGAVCNYNIQSGLNYRPATNLRYR